MSEPTKAVFLSYASQDAEAAKRICDALRAAGVEVWFDQSELRGGDAWDGMIRKRIKECALFVPLITPTTNARAEGYFRLEWKLAVDRSHLMADDAPFLFPIVTGDVTDATARVPDKFRDVQWTRLRLDETPAELGARVAKLLNGGVGASLDDARGRRQATPLRPAKVSHGMRNLGMAVGLLIGLVYALRPLWAPARRPEPKPAAVAPAVPVAPPVSAARQLAEKARALFDKIDSNADDYGVAESLLKRALELDATDGVIWAYSARLNAAYLTRSFERGTARAETARNHAERAVKLAPESAEAWHALGRAIWRSDPPRAEEALRHALQLAPDDGRVLISLGSIYRNQGRDEEALAFYVRAAAQPGVKSLALYDQFLIHLYLRRFAEADRCGREAGAVLPTTNSVTGLALLEIVWHGRVDAAQRTLDAAPAAMRSEPRMVFAAALAALMAKQSDEALRALDRLPGDFISDAWYSGPKALFVGLAHAQAGRPEAARTAWEAGLAVVRRRLQDAQNDAELHLRLGELLAWTGQAEPALHEARVFEELSRTRTDWTASSARIYAALGRAADAGPILEKFLTVTATGRWPLTPALLRLDPLWDKLRDDPRFQKLCEDPAAQTAAAAPLSEGAQLAARALALYTKIGFTRDDLAPAEEFARRATEKEPDSASAWGVRAGVQAAWLFRGWDTSEKRRQDTQSLANRALALDPNEPEALLALGHVLRAQGAFDQAVAHLRRASAANPDHVRLARAVGYTLSQSGRDAEARAALQAIVQRVPRDPLLHYELALTYGSYGSGGANPENLAAALEQLDAAIAIQPFSSALILKAALIGGWRGDLPAMRAVLDQQDKLSLAERSEDRSICVAMWAGLMEHRPDRVEAAAALTARTYFDDSVMPMRPKAWSLALAHRLAGKDNLARADWQAAEAVVRQRLKEEPGNNQYKVELAITLAWLDQREEAARMVGEVEPLWREQSTQGGARLLALYYAALGDAARAVPYLRTRLDENVFTSRKVIPLDPSWDKLRGQPEFEALLQPPAAAAPAFTLPAKPDDKSVAVLAFANLSNDKANEYFSDGISEELLNVLCKVPGLKVTARTSSFHFKGLNTAIPEIAQQLGVAYVVEGSVRKQGDKVRITAQLIKASDGFHVWSDTFTRDLKDIFAVQDEIAGLIAKNLQLTLRTNTRARTVNPEAYELLLKGRAFFDRGVPAEYPRGIQLLKDSLAIDPESAAGWGRLSMGYTLAFAQNVPGWLPRDEILGLARQAADRAIELDPEQPLGHYARCLIAYLADWDWAQADASMRRVIALTPGDAESQGLAASLALTAGQITLARDTARRAVALDPLNFIPTYQLMKAHWQSGDYVELENESRRVIAIYPSSPYGHTFLSYSLVLRGRAAEAGHVAEQVPSASYRLNSLALAYYAQGKIAEADAALEQLKQQFGATSAYQVAENYAFRKDRDRAFEWLEAAYRERDSGLTLITKDPFLANLWGDARWVAFMRKMNLPDGVAR